MVGFESQCRFEAGARQREVALLLEDEAEIGMRVGVFRPEAEGLAERVGRLIQPSQAAEGHAVIAVVGRLVGLQLHGQGDQFGGPVVLSLLMSHDAEQVQRPGMLRVSLEHAAVQRLRLREPPGLVKSYRGGEGVRGGFHGLVVSPRRKGTRGNLARISRKHLAIKRSRAYRLGGCDTTPARKIRKLAPANRKGPRWSEAFPLADPSGSTRLMEQTLNPSRITRPMDSEQPAGNLPIPVRERSPSEPRRPIPIVERSLAESLRKEACQPARVREESNDEGQFQGYRITSPGRQTKTHETKPQIGRIGKICGLNREDCKGIPPKSRETKPRIGRMAKK